MNTTNLKPGQSIKLSKSNGTSPRCILLPIHVTFYGEISNYDHERFLACAGEALRAFGFHRIETLLDGTDCEKELWGNFKSENSGFAHPTFISEAVEVMELDWLALLNSDTDEILEALKTAS